MKIIYAVFGGVIVIIIAVLLFGCNRKLHTEKTETHNATGESHAVDSLTKVVKTLSEAYESLLQSTSSSEIIVHTDTVIKVISEVTVNPDGSKTVKGGTITYRDNTATSQRLTMLRQQVIDSMNHLVRKDTVYMKSDNIETIKTVKTTSTPLLLWLVVVALACLWINERFTLFKIPFLTKK